MILSKQLATDVARQGQMYLANHTIGSVKKWKQVKVNITNIQKLLPKLYASIKREPCKYCDNIRDRYGYPSKHIVLTTKSGKRFNFCGAGALYSKDASLCSGDGTELDWAEYLYSETHADRLFLFFPAFADNNPT